MAINLEPLTGTDGGALHRVELFGRTLILSRPPRQDDVSHPNVRDKSRDPLRGSCWRSGLVRQVARSTVTPVRGGRVGNDWSAAIVLADIVGNRTSD